MTKELHFYNQPVIIVGAAGFSENDLEECLDTASVVIAADGGANYLEEKKYKLDYVIGDLDSLNNKSYWKSHGTNFIEISEQETTDFEKCLYSINAPTYFCLGFIGKRADHFLATCSILINYHFKNVILVGAHDIIFHVPKTFEMVLPVGTRLSLFPMNQIVGCGSSGLKWSISGLEFHPSKRVGTSNETNSSRVKINLSGEGMLIILPRSCLTYVKNFFINAKNLDNYV